MSTPRPPTPDNGAPTPTPPPAAEASSSALRAILTGIGIDVCGSVLLGFIIKTVYALQVRTPDMTPSQIEEAVRNIPNQSPLMVLGNLLGALLSVGAGYACARIARRDEFRTGAFMAGCTTLLSLMGADTSQDPLDLTLLFLASGAACTMLGVRYGAAQNRRIAERAGRPPDPGSP